MRRILAVALALACVAATTPSFARGGFGGGRGGIGRDPYFSYAPVPRVPNMTHRIPAPLPEPAQAPVINGPVSQPALRGLTGIGE
jgi:hypothetical protein